MLYLAYFEATGKLSYITGTFQTGFPTFPVVFTKQAETRSAVAAKDVKVVTNLVKPFKTFGSIR